MSPMRCCFALLLFSSAMVLTTAYENSPFKFEAFAKFLPTVPCAGKYDVVAILDRSYRLDEETYKGYMEILKDLVGVFDIKEGGNHFGLVLYNYNAQVAMKLNENNNGAFIRNYLQTSLPVRQGGRNLGRALRETQRQLLTEPMGDRPDAANVCLVLTTARWIRPRWGRQYTRNFCDRYIVLRGRGDDDVNRVKQTVCPDLTPDEAKNKTFGFCEGLFPCNGTHFKELTAKCNANVVKTACPIPYVDVEGNCYQAVFTKMNVDAMTTECTNRDGHLAQIDNAEKNTQFAQYLISLKASRADWAFWIGLRDRTGNNADWKWINDESNLTFSNWGNNQPNNNGQRCVLAVANPIFGGTPGIWDDFGCNANFGGICETDRVVV